MDSTKAIVPRADLGYSWNEKCKRDAGGMATNKTCSSASTKSLLGIGRDKKEQNAYHPYKITVFSAV